ncbi:MAG: alpha/beta hydrolase [Clostridiales bacterium]|nr:alpha/beta hydrolase [Clostridiales bacterium]
MIENLDYKYIDNHSEETIVLLHGWGLSKNCFEKIVHNLSDRCNILYLDFFGFSGSSEPQFSYDTYEYACQIFILLKKLNLKNLTIFGHSFGGRIAIILSSVFDLNIKKIILASSAGLYRFNIIKFIKIKTYKFIKKIKIFNSKNASKFGSRDYKKLSPKMKQSFVKIVNQNLEKLLSKIQCDVLLIWGGKDRDTPIWICNKINRYVKQSKKIIYKNCGHFACFEKMHKTIEVLSN